jgi:hypothetical protein
VAQQTREPEPSRQDVAPDDKSELPGLEPGSLSEEVRRSVGYADADSEAGAKAPDLGALSQLDYQTSQSLNQRANEAFGYLGVRSFESPAELEIAKSRPAPRSESRLLATLDTLGEGREALHRSRDEAAAHALREKKAVGGLVSDGKRAELDRAVRQTRRSGPPTERPTLSPAQRFERERRSLENLTFLPASGYWANTYVPGDPVLRWLESRLEKRDRAALAAFSSRPLLLEAAAHQTPQPFDPPSRAALSVFLQGDRRGLEGEARMLVQVGLQGARRHGGLRPAMKVGVVLDLRGTIEAEAAHHRG